MEDFNKQEFKLFKINKNKPLQFKRNLLIEKYVDNYLTDQNKVESAHLSLKSINQKCEENKNDNNNNPKYFVKKKPISQTKLSLQDHEDTDSTTIISNYFNKPLKTNTSTSTNINYRNIPTKLSAKTRTVSCSNLCKNINNISVNKKAVMRKKNAGKSFSLRNRVNSNSNLNSHKSLTNISISRNSNNNNNNTNNNVMLRNKNSNVDFFREYERISQTQKMNNNTFVKTFQLKKESSQLFRKKFSNILNEKLKHNRFYTNNHLSTTMDNTTEGFNGLKNLKGKNNISHNIINKKIHKEINIEDFLLIEKKFEEIKYILSNLINKYKEMDFENNKSDVDINELYISCNFHIYDLYKFYMNSSIEGMPETLFTSSKTQKILHEYSIIFMISLGTIYINNIFNNYNFYFNKNIILLNIQQKLFLLFCDGVLKKLNTKYNSNIWVKKLLEELNNKLIFNINDNISQIKLLTQDSYKLINDILESLYQYIFINNNINDNKEKINLFLYLYNNFYRKDFEYFDSLNIVTLEELFNRIVFKIDEFQNRNILNDINCVNNNEYLDKYKYNNIDTKVPYLKFPCKKEYTLILDLDETMICFKCSKEKKNVGNIHIRPGLEIFLEIIKEFYEIIIFTVGTREYANVILDLIEQKNNTKFFDGRLYREHATKVGNKYIKDLSKIGRDLSKTLIVDNNPHSFKFQHENGILINSYFGEKNDDKALIELQKILIKIYKEKNDVRASISKYKEEIIQKVSCSNELKLI